MFVGRGFWPRSKACTMRWALASEAGSHGTPSLPWAFQGAYQLLKYGFGGLHTVSLALDSSFHLLHFSTASSPESASLSFGLATSTLESNANRVQ
jgi:hypothetical protein